jgi:hypothetical protein
LLGDDCIIGSVPKVLFVLMVLLERVDLSLFVEEESSVSDDDFRNPAPLTFFRRLLVAFPSQASKPGSSSVSLGTYRGFGLFDLAANSISAIISWIVLSHLKQISTQQKLRNEVNVTSPTYQPYGATIWVNNIDMKCSVGHLIAQANA